MRMHSKYTVALLSLAIGSALALGPLAMGQSAAPAPPPPAATASTHMHRHMRPQSMGPRGWGGDRDGWRTMGWRHHHRHHGFMLARMVNNPTFRERLGITPEQAQKIRSETLQFQENHIRNRADLQIKRLQLQNLMTADSPDRSAIDKQLQEISAARLTQTESDVNFYLDMRTALTPDQKLKLRQMRQDFFRHRGFGPGGPGGPDGPDGPDGQQGN